MTFERNKILFVYDFYYRYGFLQIGLSVLAYFVFVWYKMQFNLMPIVCCGFIAFLGTYNVLAGRSASKRIDHLNDPKESTLGVKELRKMVPGLKKDRFFLGWGYPWKVQHVQMYHQIRSEMRNEKVGVQNDDLGGRHFVHNMEPDERVVDLPLPRHTIIAGTTGIGKTRFMELLAVQIIEKGQTAIFIDPKGDQDLLNAVFQACVAAGREDDFEVVSLAHPSKSSFINPMANFKDSGALASRITSIMPQAGDSQPFVDFCYDVLATVIDVMLMIDKRITLRSIRKYAVMDMESLLADAKDFLNGSVASHQAKLLTEAIEDLQKMVEHNSEHFSKMTTSLKPVMRTLTHGRVGALLSPEIRDMPLAWESIVSQNKIVYLSLASMIDDSTASNVGKLVMQDLVNFIGEKYSFDPNAGDKPLHVFVDEFYSVAYEGYVDALNKTRAAGVHLYLGMQTTADIEAILGAPMRRQIFGLVENKIWLRIPDTELAEEFSTVFGEVAIAKRVQMRGINANPGDAQELFHSSSSERIDMADVPLLPSDILTTLPRGHAMISTDGRDPIKFRFPLLRHDDGTKINFFKDVIIGDTNRLEEMEFESTVENMEHVPPEDWNHV
ncbi:MAG: type IV secretion system DNA-binding domain-containing protein [Proteobacteria bacterium]|nr:type IV secretion system DNA-binding domain-containing protein [Pseudomonadota bacterium]